MEKKSKSIENKLNILRTKCKECTACPLAKQGRIQPVFAEGNPYTKLMFIGEAPGRDEDQQCRPFVGRSGKLLTKIIEAMNLKREDVYISNVVKCRPPNNRTPSPVESLTCKKLFLLNEIKIINPQIICTLGACSSKALLGDVSISKIRGIFHKFNNSLIIPTYHPAYLLRNPAAKKENWSDMQKILTELKK